MNAETVGRLHAWRDRGAVYVDGFRTSMQAAVLAAGVAKGAGFTDTTWALSLGVAVVLGLEGAKMIAGWLDYHYGIIHMQQAMTLEASPVIMRQTEALERIEQMLLAR